VSLFPLYFLVSILYLFKKVLFLVPLASANVGELGAHVNRGRDGVGEGYISYRSDCIGHGLPTLQPRKLISYLDRDIFELEYL